jgi:hypothetical protein
VPGQDIVLAGRSYAFKNVLADLAQTARTGAYEPFGTETHPRQVKCSGAVLRYDPDRDNLELVTWGLRDPYGLAFAPDGRLLATEHGADERGGRYIVGDYDDFYEITLGASMVGPTSPRVSGSMIHAGGSRAGPGAGAGRAPRSPSAQARGVLRAACGRQRPGLLPPGSLRIPRRGVRGPVRGPGAHHRLRPGTPAGFKVVRIDPRRRQIIDFAVIRIAGPASKLSHAGFERPSHCALGTDGALHVVDWGEIEIAAEKGGVRMRAGSGALWRIRRTRGPRAEQPPRPLVLPYYAIQFVVLLGLLTAGLALGVAWLLRRKGRS